MAFGVPPVEFALDPVVLPLASAPHTALVAARLYDFGVLTLAVRLPADGMPWSDFVQLMDAMDRWVGEGADTTVWAGLLAQVRATFSDALIRPAVSTVEEDYLIATVEAFSETLTAEQVLKRVDLVPLLSGEQRALSTAARQDLLRQRF